MINTDSDKGDGVVFLDSTHYYNKIMEFLNNKNHYKQISQQTINKKNISK